MSLRVFFGFEPTVNLILYFRLTYILRFSENKHLLTGSGLLTVYTYFFPTFNFSPEFLRDITGEYKTTLTVPVSPFIEQVSVSRTNVRLLFD